MKRFGFKILLSVVSTLLLVTSCHMPDDNNAVHRLSRDSGKALMRQADSLYYENPDSALILYTVLANRFEKNGNSKTNEMALRAALSRWELIFFNHFDYSAAFDALSQVEIIANTLEKTEPRIPLYTGLMYHTAYEQTLADEPGRMALDNFHLALRQGAETGDWPAVRMAFGNLTELVHSLDCIDSIAHDAEFYNKVARHHLSDKEITFDIGYYRALRLLSDGDNKGAQALLDSISTLISPDNFRYRCAIGIVNAEILVNTGKGKQALIRLDSLEKMSMAANMRDGRLIFYNLRAAALENLGDKNGADMWRTKHVMLKDSLLNYQQVEQLNRHKFMTRINEMERHMNAMRERHRSQMLIISMAVLIILIICIFLWLLYCKNRRLSDANKVLYQRTVEMLNDRHFPGQKGDEKGKYINSTLSEETKENLWEKVMDVLETSDEIYTPDFSLSRLCEMCGGKEKYVSQVINEHGENFSTCLNNRRIDEACRRIEDTGTYGHLTLEGIGNSVGFKSPNSFRQNFRRRTGLTPSQYQYQARNNRN